MKFKKSLIAIVAILLISSVFVITGCKKEEPLAKGSNQAQLAVDSQQAPWEEVRYNYDYLKSETKSVDSRLSNKISFEDLKQLHDIANIMFGDYLTELTLNFDKRSLDVLDNNLFINESAKKEAYTFLIGDFADGYYNVHYDISNIKNIPNIKLMTDKTGERGKYIFVTVRVYFPTETDDQFDEIGDEAGKWKYIVMQLERTADTKHGWKVCHQERINYYLITGEIKEGPWTIMMNEQDDFTKIEIIPEPIWKYFIGETSTVIWDSQEEDPNKGIESSYNNNAAASYSYNYAFNYNPAYYSWASNGTDCANFVSQCLDAGGLPQNSTWKYYSTYPYGTSAWRGANALYTYLRNNRGYVVSREDLYSGYYGGSCVLQWGDVLAMNYSSDPTVTTTNQKKHVMIITHSYQHINQYYNGTLRYKISGHTTDRQDYDLIALGNSYVRYHVLGVHITYGLV